MMGIDRFHAADLATLLVEFARLDGPLDSKMRFIFTWVGTPPIGLPGIGFEHLRSVPVLSFV
jgi:hypothetical protein